MARDFRFGWQLTAAHRPDPVAAALRAELIGFDIFLTSDHVGPGLSPMPTLAAVAAATSEIRLGTFVLNADMRNPVQLAWETTTLDHLSGGRFELGLGAGHTPHEYAATGFDMQSPAARKAALAERVEIIRRLLDGEVVDWDSDHHHLAGAKIDRSTQDRLPILVGGNGDALLAHAARHADIIGLQGLGRTQQDGHRHAVQWTSDHLDSQLAQIRRSAGSNVASLELNALVQVVDITDDAQAAVADMCSHVDGLTPDDVADTPYVLIGTVDEIVTKLHTCRDRWGISYFAVRELDAFAPIIAGCR